MICPGCQADSIQEYTPSCPSCGFDMADVDQMFGVAPNLRAKVTSFTDLVSPGEIRRLERHAQNLGLEFPQCRFTVVFTRIPQDVSLSAYTFWLFNKGGAAAPGETGSLSRLILLLIDVEGPRCSCMVGYGLEPFFTASRLENIIQPAQPYLRSHSFSHAAAAMLDHLKDELLSLSGVIPRTFGLDESETSSTSVNGEEVYAY